MRLEPAGSEAAGPGGCSPGRVPAGQVSGCGGQPGPQGVTEHDYFMFPPAAFGRPPPGPFHNPGSRAALSKPGALREHTPPVFSCRIFPGHE